MNQKEPDAPAREHQRQLRKTLKWFLDRSINLDPRNKENDKM